MRASVIASRNRKLLRFDWVDDLHIFRRKAHAWPVEYVSVRWINACSESSNRRWRASITNRDVSCNQEHTSLRSYGMAAAEQRGQQPRALQLTDVEAQLRRLLLDVASYINKDKPSELRYTGGWVRDKLLGVDSHDIDVAINDMTGYQFGLRLKEYLELPGNAEKYGLQGPSSASSAVADKRTLVHELHKIEANPEKSKHLETVTTKILGLDVDLVNLRKEVYDELSRNPQMEFGGPKEDADRRDATINAMFYNLQTQLVEDFTGRGLQDLESKIIMTPLEPLQTFKDDPLRILRLIRFSSRLNFAIDQSALENMKDPSVLHSLKVKISRERIGVELEKMLKGQS